MSRLLWITTAFAVAGAFTASDALAQAAPTTPPVATSNTAPTAPTTTVPVTNDAKAADDKPIVTWGAPGSPQGAASSSTPTSAQINAVDVPLSANSPTRKQSLVPHPIEEEPEGGIKFTADPIGDGAILAMSLGFAAISELIISTGEIRPQQIDPSFDANSLLGIDRGAISQKVDSNAGPFSTVGLIAAIGFAVAHPIISGVKRGREAFLVDAVIYAESMSIAWGVGDLAKIAVRRPRPIAYIDRNNFVAGGGDPAKYDNTSTDSSLSFYSGHTTEVAAISATATYLTFSRYGARDARPWIALIAGSALTTFVAIERVRAGAHFPTDTIAGAMAGAGIGLLVPHLHREDSVRQRPVWVGFAPSLESKGGVVTFGGGF